MQVEDITGVSLTAWGTPQEQGHLPISDGLLGQIVKNDQGVHAVVTEKLAHGTSGVGGQVLQGSGIGSGGRDNDTEIFEE